MIAKKSLNTLPFVKTLPTGEVESYWRAEPTSNYAADNRRGAEYAVLFIEFMRQNKAHHMFAQVIRDLAIYGRRDLGALNGIAVGFLHEIAKRSTT